MNTKNKFLSAILALLIVTSSSFFASCASHSGTNDISSSSDESISLPSSSESSSSQESDSSSESQSESSKIPDNPTINLDDVKDLYSSYETHLKNLDYYKMITEAIVKMSIMNMTLEIPVEITEIVNGDRYSAVTMTDPTGQGTPEVDSLEVYDGEYLYVSDALKTLKQKMSSDEFNSYKSNKSDSSNVSAEEIVFGFKNITASYTDDGNYLIEYSDPTETLMQKMAESFNSLTMDMSDGTSAVSALYGSAIITKDGQIVSESIHIEMQSAPDPNYGVVSMVLDMSMSVYVEDPEEITAPSDADKYTEVESIQLYDQLNEVINSVMNVQKGSCDAEISLMYSEHLNASGELTYKYSYFGKNDSSFDFTSSQIYFQDEVTAQEDQTGYEKVFYSASNSYINGSMITTGTDGEISTPAQPEEVYAYVYLYISYAYADVTQSNSLEETLISSGNTSEENSCKVISFKLNEEAAYVLISDYAAQFSLDLTLIENAVTDADCYVKFTDDYSSVETNYVITFSGDFEGEVSCSCTLTLTADISAE